MNLERQRKVNNIEKTVVMNALLKHRWSKEILNDSPCLDENQEYMVMAKTARELSLASGVTSWVPDEDIAVGIEMYSIVHNCPASSVEAAKLSVFFDSLLTDQNLNSVVAATMHNIQPLAGDKITDFTAINMWYDRLDARYNFSLGTSILGLMSTDQLNQMGQLDPPYLKDYKDYINFDNMTLFFGKRPLNSS